MRITSVKFSFLQMNNLRMDSSYHINDTITYCKHLSACPYPITTIGAESEKIFLGNIFTREYVADKEHGIPYLSASEMQKSDLNTGKYLSKKQAEHLQYLMFDSNWILISCSGTLGKCVYTDKRYSEMIGTHDLIRLIPKKNDIEPGVLYAFLSGKFGYAMLTRSQYGSVVQHTNPSQVSGIPVPVFSDELQKKVHALITESAKLREEADADLKKAISYFDNQTPQKLKTFTGSISKSQIINHYHRLDAQYQLGIREMASIHKACQYDQIKIADLAQRIFVGDRGKRMYSARGVPFVSSSDMMLFNAGRTAKAISKNNPGLESLIVHENDILISRSGTVGNVIIIGKDLAETAISEHALRLTIDKNKISPLYVFVFLKSHIAQFRMNFSAYGSVIITLNETMIGDIRIPILPKEQMDLVIALAESYKNKLSEAAEKENEAIRLIEEEIEKWQK